MILSQVVVNWLNKLYPNPTAGTFTLLLKEAEETTPIKVEIYSMLGKCILQTQLSGQQQYEFDLSSRPVGVYLVRVVRGEEVGVEKVVKQ
jgi:trimeric autotransporter adhesin